MEILAVLLALVSFVLGGDVDRCPAGLPRSRFLKTFNEQCYQFNHYQVKWQAAENICRMNGGHLVVIKNAATQNFLMRSLKSLSWSRNGLWIGANDLVSEMRWKWVTGESIGYSYWGSGQPSCKIFRCREDCAILRYSDGGRWHDKPCDDSFYIYSFVCQYDMIPTTTTSTTVTTTVPATVTTTVPTTVTTTVETTVTTTIPTTVTTLSSTNSTEEMMLVQEDLLMKADVKSLNKVREKTTIKMPSTTAKTAVTTTTAKPTTTSDKQKYSVLNDSGHQKQHLEESHEHRTGAGTIIALALGLMLGLVVGICFGAVCFIRRRKKKQQHGSASFINPYYGEVTQVDDDSQPLEQSCVVEYKDDVQVEPTVPYDTLPSLSLTNPLYGEAARPGTSRPGTTCPGTSRPGTSRPGTTCPGTSRPGTSRPGTSRPGTTCPGTVRPGPSDSYDLPKPTPCGLLPKDIYQNSNPYENTLPAEENFYEDIDTIKAAIAMNESLDKGEELDKGEDLDKGEEEDRYVSMPTRNVV